MPAQDPTQPMDYSRFRQRSRFGNVDTGRLLPMESILGTMAQGDVASQGKEIARQKDELDQAFINQQLGHLQSRISGAAAPTDVNRSLDDTTLGLLRYGSPKARQTAGDIQKLRRADHPDMNLTADEAYLRGYINFDKYKQMKQAGRTIPEKYVWREKMVNGRPATQLVGRATRIVEEEVDRNSGKLTGNTRTKPASMEPNPAGGGTTTAKESLLERMYGDFTDIDSQLKDLRAGIYRGRSIKELFPDRSDKENQIWIDNEARRLTGDLTGKSTSIRRLERELGITDSGLPEEYKKPSTGKDYNDLFK